MGGTNYGVTELVVGTDLGQQTNLTDRAYQSAVSRASAEYGHQQGYCGSIQQSYNGYTILTELRPQIGTPEFYTWQSDQLNNLAYGVAECIQLTPKELSAARKQYRWQHLKGKRNVTGWYFFGWART